jgi:hypothetical protein
MPKESVLVAERSMLPPPETEHVIATSATGCPRRFRTRNVVAGAAVPTGHTPRGEPPKDSIQAGSVDGTSGVLGVFGVGVVTDAPPSQALHTATTKAARISLFTGSVMEASESC